jgi:hypothetical protein
VPAFVSLVTRVARPPGGRLQQLQVPRASDCSGIGRGLPSRSMAT